MYLWNFIFELAKCLILKVEVLKGVLLYKATSTVTWYNLFSLWNFVQTLCKIYAQCTIRAKTHL